MHFHGIGGVVEYDAIGDERRSKDGNQCKGNALGTEA